MPSFYKNIEATDTGRAQQTPSQKQVAGDEEGIIFSDAVLGLITEKKLESNLKECEGGGGGGRNKQWGRGTPYVQDPK